MKRLLFFLLLISSLLLPAQNIKWVHAFDTTTTNSIPGRIAIDDSANVYVSYYNQSLSNLTQVISGLKSFIVKYDSLGNKKWLKILGKATTLTGMRYYNGTIYLTMYTTDSVLLGGNYYQGSVLASMNRLGNINWATSFTANPYTRFSQLYIAHNHIYVAGSGNGGCLLLRYDLNGVQQDLKNLDDLFVISDIVVDSEKGVYLTGTSDEFSFIDSTQFPSPPWGGSYVSYLIRLDSNWAVDWIKTNNYFTFNHNGKLLQRGDTIYYLHISDSSSIRDLKLQTLATDGSLYAQKKVLTNISFYYHDNVSAAFIPFGPEYKLAVLGQVNNTSPVLLSIFNRDLSLLRRDSIGTTQLNHSAITGGKSSYALAFASNDSLYYNNRFQAALGSVWYQYPGACLYLQEQKPLAGFTYSDSVICSSDTLVLQDTSLYGPLEWKWKIDPPYFSFTGNTTDTSGRALLLFDSTATYDIKLVVTNTLGADSVLKSQVVNVVSQDSFALSYQNGVLSGPSIAGGFQWFRNDSLLANDTAASIQLLHNGNYKLRVRIDSCESWSYSFVVADVGMITASVGNFNIYPNPAKRLLNITTPEKGPIEYLIWDMKGMVLLKGLSSQNSFTLELPRLPGGLYILELRQAHKSFQSLLEIEP